MAWVVPTIAYVLLVGLFGIAAQYGLRQVTWQGLVGLTPPRTCSFSRVGWQTGAGVVLIVGGVILLGL